jgi:hypothetical protein
VWTAQRMATAVNAPRDGPMQRGARGGAGGLGGMAGAAPPSAEAVQVGVDSSPHVGTQLRA